MDYYYIDEFGNTSGPVPESAIRALYKGGLIKNTTPIAPSDTHEWTPYSAVFGFVNGPVPPPHTMALAPSPYVKLASQRAPARSEAHSGSSAFWWWLLALAVLVAVLAASVAAHYNKLPFSPPGTTFGSAMPQPAGTKIDALASSVSPGPGSQAKAAAKVEAKEDPLAEWYDFGFQQGKDARQIFGSLGRTIEPTKAQLVQLLANMELTSSSISQERLNACFDGYKDGYNAAKPARIVAVAQNKSSLPLKLRGYHKFDDDTGVGSASSEALSHALACVAMIVTRIPQGYAYGSGFIIGPGMLVTNRHVVAGGDSYQVRLPDKTVVEGKLVAVSETYDVALLAIPVSDRPMMRMAAAEGVRVGDHIAAVGFPEPTTLADWAGKQANSHLLQEMEATSTFGQISAVNRKFEDMDCFQMDLTINHGNSGGPTVDAQGRVIGINTFTLQPVNLERTNFCIKISSVISFIRQNCGFAVDLED